MKLSLGVIVRVPCSENIVANCWCKSLADWFPLLNKRLILPEVSSNSIQTKLVRSVSSCKLRNLFFLQLSNFRQLQYYICGNLQPCGKSGLNLTVQSHIKETLGWCPPGIATEHCWPSFSLRQVSLMFANPVLSVSTHIKAYSSHFWSFSFKL